jgi:hypothetical protein
LGKPLGLDCNSQKQTNFDTKQKDFLHEKYISSTTHKKIIKDYTA